MAENTGIAVIESKWWKGSNTSVRGMFDLVSDIAHGNPNTYHYEMAMSRGALEEAIPRVASDVKCKYLYIATHGSKDGLELYNGDLISRKALREIFIKVASTPRSRFSGVHLGSCYFTTDKLAKYLFDGEINLKWIAGYTAEVSWMESAALDLLFFNELVQLDGETDVSGIESVAQRLNSLASGLQRKLGFGIFARKKGGGIRNLVSTDPVD